MSLAPPTYLSPSSIGTFQQCPLKFKYSRIDRLPEPPTVHTLLGNFVHEILEDLYQLPPAERTQASARAIARQKWDENYVASAKSLRLNEHDFRWKAWFCVENVWKLEKPENTDLSGIEHEVNGEVSGVKVKGFIDRFEHRDDGTIFIGDYKTGKIPGDRFLDDKFVQLLIYALMFRETNVGVVSKVGLIYLAGPRVFTKNVTNSDLDKVTNLIVSTKNSVDAFCSEGEFPAKPSNLCNWCHFKKICPAWTRK